MQKVKVDNIKYVRPPRRLESFSERHLCPFHIWLLGVTCLL